MILCDYGCGNEAKYTMTNGKRCCSKSYNSCPAIKLKNSKSIKKMHSEGRGFRFFESETDEQVLNRCEKIKKTVLRQQHLLDWDVCSLGEKQRRVLKEQNGKCLLCNLTDWQGKPIKLHFDHINGDRSDNRRENVRFLCPNCHSQTDTYCRFDSNKKFTNDDFLEALKENNWTIAPALKQLGLAQGGFNWNRAKKLIEKIWAYGEIGSTR